MEQIKDMLQEHKDRFPWRTLWTVLIVVSVVFGIIWVGMYSYARGYEGRVVPGVYIGETPIGGMNREELKRFLQQMNDKLISEGLHVVLQTQQGEHDILVYPVIVSETNSVELLTIDIEHEVERLMDYGKQGNIFARAVAIVRSRIGGSELQLESVQADADRIMENLDGSIAPFQTHSRNANVIVNSVDPLEYDVVTSSIGATYQYAHVVDAFRNAWAKLMVPYVPVEKQEEHPQVSDQALESILDTLPAIFEAGDITIVYDNPNRVKDDEWIVDTDTIAQFLVVQPLEETEEDNGQQGTEDMTFVFALDLASTTQYLQQEVGEDVYVEAQDAKFSISNGKVSEFQGSQAGLALDTQATYEALNEVIIQRNFPNEGTPSSTINAIVNETEPEVETADINDLGISELLGEGVSSYAGSPSNRIKNIQNAIRKLNGLLIKPGEEFSTIEHTQPYTLEGGYLPELVIKGNEIKPEIGGGLCQIGSTLFRMAMNSGMPITERRNHSLVVNYYNDLTNGLPGTDATIYDPAPDFRFKNDTDHYILVQAEMDEVNQHLVFSLWGTSDGRTGSYSAPVVHRWIPHGQTQYIKTTKLAPGVQECQHAYRGADASFVYTRTLPDGTEENRTFESHYRPLPQICLVGVSEEELTCEDPEGCAKQSDDSTASESSEDDTQNTQTPQQETVVEEEESVVLSEG